jgi:acyl-CoA reductase-like NAD-dependent aldehyde dehydrogenase
MTDTAVETPTFRHFIAGEWCDSTSGETFESRDPADTRDGDGGNSRCRTAVRHHRRSVTARLPEFRQHKVAHAPNAVLPARQGLCAELFQVRRDELSVEEFEAALTKARDPWQSKGTRSPHSTRPTSYSVHTTRHR